MRKIIFIGIAVVFIIMPLAAQVDFGVKAGISYSALVQKVENTYESGARPGFSIGGVADIPLHFIYKRISLRPEIAFVNQGGSWYSAVDKEGPALHNKCWYNSLHVPVNVVFTFPFYDMDISLFAGPSFDFSLFGKMTSRETDVDLQFGQTDEKDLKRFDVGANLGLAVEYKRYFFSINSNCGVLDRRAVKRDGESSVFQNNVTFSLGYYFRKN